MEEKIPETLDRLDCVILCLTTVETQLPYGLAQRTGLGTSSIYARLARLCQLGLAQKLSRQRNVFYASYLSLPSILEMVKKYPEVLTLYPEIAKLIDRRRQYGERNNSESEENPERIQHLDTKGGD